MAKIDVFEKLFSNVPGRAFQLRPVVRDTIVKGLPGFLFSPFVDVPKNRLTTKQEKEEKEKEEKQEDQIDKPA